MTLLQSDLRRPDQLCLCPATIIELRDLNRAVIYVSLPGEFAHFQSSSLVGCSRQKAFRVDLLNPGFPWLGVFC